MTKISRNWTSASVQMANACALSASVIVAGRPVVGLMMPDEWTAASVSFLVSACAGGTFRPLYGDDGNEVAFEGGACQAVAHHTKLEKVGAWFAAKIQSGSSYGDQDNQGAARAFVLFMQG